jgi:transposase
MASDQKLPATPDDGMRSHEPTLEYVSKGTAQELSKREIIRCLKRYIAREVFNALPRQANRQVPQIAA